MQDDYEGNYSTRRSLLYTIRFTAKTYLFEPVGDTSKASKDLIKKVRVGYVQDDSSTPTRDLTYTVVPRATQKLHRKCRYKLGTRYWNNIQYY